MRPLPFRRKPATLFRFAVIRHMIDRDSVFLLLFPRHHGSRFLYLAIQLHVFSMGAFRRSLLSLLLLRHLCRYFGLDRWQRACTLHKLWLLIDTAGSFTSNIRLRTFEPTQVFACTFAAPLALTTCSFAFVSRCIGRFARSVRRFATGTAFHGRIH